MARYLTTPTGTVDLTDPRTAQPQLLDIIERLSAQLTDARDQRRSHTQEAGRHRQRADKLEAHLAELEQTDTARLRAELQAERAKTRRRTKRVDRLVAEKRDMAAQLKKVTDRDRELTKTNARYREQIAALKVDLGRARAGATSGGSGVLSDLQIASLLLTELHDRLVGEARRTHSPQVATALRLAAREVTRTGHQLSERCQLAAAS